MAGGNKFLVQMLGTISAKHLFFLIWLAIAGFFTTLIVWSYRRAYRRNFRSPSEGLGPRVRVDHRQLPRDNAQYPARKE